MTGRYLRRFSRGCLSPLMQTLALLVLATPLGHAQPTGEFLSPSGCSPQSCDYTCRWVYDQLSDSITWSITAKQDTGTWTAVAFSSQPAMENQDTIYGYVDSGGAGIVRDAYVASRYTTPVVDSSSSLLQSSISYVDGMYNMTFKRQRISNDSQDVSFTDTPTLYFKFPVGGGSVSGSSIRMHTRTPIVSAQQICVGPCGAATMKPNVTTAIMQNMSSAATMSVGNMTTAMHMGNMTTTMSVGNMTTTMPMGNMTTTMSVGNMTTTMPMGNMTTKMPMGNMSTTMPLGNMTTKMLMGNMTTTMHMGNMTATMHMGNMTTTMHMGNMTTKMSVGNMTTTMHMGNMTSQMQMGNMTTTMHMGNMTTTMHMGNITTKMPMGNMTTAMHMGNMTTKMSMGNMTTKMLMGNMTTTMHMGNMTTTMHMGNMTTMMHMGNMTSQMQMGNMTTNVPMESSTSEGPKRSVYVTIIASLAVFAALFLLIVASFCCFL